MHSSMILRLSTLALLTLVGSSAFAQATSAVQQFAVVTGQPFSATRYTRTLEPGPDGKLRVTSEERDTRLARDADGRIAVEKQYECDPSRICATHGIALYDFSKPTITPWLWGQDAAHVATTITLTAAQLQAAEVAVAKLDESSDAETSVEDLGSGIIEGVPVTGVRIRLAPSGGAPNSVYAVTREVWTSPELKVILRVITTDPEKCVTMAGLENVSRHPDPSFFNPPEGYELNGYNKGAVFAEPYLKQLAEAEGR